MLERFLASKTEYAYALLRIVTGAMFAVHGVTKLFHMWLPPNTTLSTQMWIGGVIELACGVLIAIGAMTRYAAFLASGTMAVAYIQFHWKFAFGKNFLPYNNGGEEALLYAFVWLFIACKGAGIWSVDGKRG
jgi:putative oxidoreductase